MNKLMSAAAAGLAMLATPAIADDHNDGMGEMTEAQMTAYNAMSADRRAAYDALPMEGKTYFWTLNSTEQMDFLRISNDDRMRLMAMQPNMRRDAMAQMRSGASNSMANNGMQNTNTRANMGNGQIRFVSNARVQSAPAPRQGEYPICQSDAQDNCINAWEAGKRGRGVSRPLDYWPGRPASEM